MKQRQFFSANIALTSCRRTRAFIAMIAWRRRIEPSANLVATTVCETAIPRPFTLEFQLKAMLSTAIIGLALTLAPYAGQALNGSIPGTAKFLVSITGASGQTVKLRTVGIPKGYIASFCTNLVCAPFHVALALPKSGHEDIELQLIENAPGVHKPRIVTVTANGLIHASIAFSRATH